MFRAPELTVSVRPRFLGVTAAQSQTMINGSELSSAFNRSARSLASSSRAPAARRLGRRASGSRRQVPLAPFERSPGSHRAKKVDCSSLANAFVQPVWTFGRFDVWTARLVAGHQFVLCQLAGFFPLASETKFSALCNLGSISSPNSNSKATAAQLNDSQLSSCERKQVASLVGLKSRPWYRVTSGGLRALVSRASVLRRRPMTLGMARSC